MIMQDVTYIKQASQMWRIENSYGSEHKFKVV